MVARTYLADAVDAHVVRAQRTGRTVEHRLAPVGNDRVIHIAAEQATRVVCNVKRSYCYVGLNFNCEY